jgi:hypothetical protein
MCPKLLLLGHSLHGSVSVLVSCGHCGCSLVGEVKKARHVYYRCTGYRGKCAEPYTREETLEQEFAARLRGLVVPPSVMEWLQSELAQSDQTERAARAQAVRRQQTGLERLQARMGRTLRSARAPRCAQQRYGHTHATPAFFGLLSKKCNCG